MKIDTYADLHRETGKRLDYLILETKNELKKPLNDFQIIWNRGRLDALQEFKGLSAELTEELTKQPAGGDHGTV